MKTLLVLRHAKAEASSPDGTDISRPLAERGRKDAALAGKALRKLDLVPDLVLCSPAVRTRETADLVFEKLKSTVPIQYESSIYEASAGALVHLLRTQETGNRILLVGHNPGLEELASRLIAGSQSLIQLPTCGMVRVDFEMDDWDDIVEVAGRLVWFLEPSVLKSL